MRLKPFHMLALALLAVGLFMIAFPSEGTAAATRGIAIWWDVLFPALFPFFVIAELMLGFGLVHFFGMLLDPLMRPLFRVPGIGGFVMAMGFASGYPVAARLTSQLWDQNLVNREEGERLVAFTTTSDPIFLIGAVSVGFFHDVRLAVVLAAAHYGSAVLLGFLMRFHGRGGKAEPTSSSRSYKRPPKEQSLLKRAFAAMHEARLRDGRVVGTMLNQAIKIAIQLIMVVGGLVVFFSVVLEAMRVTHFLDYLSAAIGTILGLFGMPGPLAEAIISGLFEVTLGAKAAGAGGASIPLMYQVSAAAFVLSWAGFSVHAQIVSLLYRTPFRYTPFVVARLLHGILSAGAVLLLWDRLQPVQSAALTALASLRSSEGGPRLEWGTALPALLMLFAAAVALLLAFSVIFAIIKGIGKRFSS
ncbi:sporulation integral membrane protein YlbJ [Paenibacillus sp. MBLB4367]|uniref:sporulation integral membrane protein YlbJ n=1 Tax=Paenibacillus sp. MBLB4367 TaxID=3384767 RepID=UPI003908043A